MPFEKKAGRTKVKKTLLYISFVFPVDCWLKRPFWNILYPFFDSLGFIFHFSIFIFGSLSSRLLNTEYDDDDALGFQLGPEGGYPDSRTKKISSFLFHPFLPFALSIQQTLFLQSAVNVHFRRWNHSVLFPAIVFHMFTYVSSHSSMYVVKIRVICI